LGSYDKAWGVAPGLERCDRPLGRCDNGWGEEEKMGEVRKDDDD